MPATTQPASSDSVGSTKKTCPLTPATLVVVTLRGDTGDFVVADVTIKGKTPGSGKTAADTGSKSFENIKGDEYTIEATNPVVQRSPAGAGAPADKPSFEPAKEVKTIVPPGGEVMCVIEFVRQAQLKVKVYFLDDTAADAKEELIGDVTVRLRFPDPAKLVEKVTAKGTGLVDFGAVPAGLYNLAVTLTDELAKLYPNPAVRNVRLARGENLTVPLRLEKRGKKRLRLLLLRGPRLRTGNCRVDIEGSPTAPPLLKIPRLQISDGTLDVVVPAHVATMAKAARVYFLGVDDQDNGEALYLAVGQMSGDMSKTSVLSNALRATGFFDREALPDVVKKYDDQLELDLAAERSRRIHADE